mgnify:CR=1 FL=1
MSEGDDELLAGLKDVSESALQNMASDVIRCAERMDGITRFSGVVAHDVNNILAIILGNLELLDYELIENPKVRTRLASIQKASERASELTNQLLGISRRRPKSSIVTSVNEELKRIHQLILAEVPTNVTLTLTLDESLWLTSIDPDDFQEALLNLIINACEAMPDGGELALATANVKLDRDYCSLNPGVNPGDYVAVSVMDTGRGIPADVLPFVFEPFVSSKEETKSAGMGLPQVYGFCQRSNGHVRLEPSLNIGTTARLYLPSASERAKAANTL